MKKREYTILAFHFRRDGETGRHAGLKILWPETAVRVRFPLPVRKAERESERKR